MDDNKNARNSYNKKFSVDSIFLIKSKYLQVFKFYDDIVTINNKIVLF